MKAWRLNNKQEFELFTDTRQPNDDEMKINITKCAFSSTDFALMEGKGDVYPIVPGRCAVGLASEAVGNLKLGERVYIHPYLYDASENCPEKQRTGVKIMGLDTDGFLSDFAIVPKVNVISLPDNVKDGEALFVESIAIAAKTFDRLKVQKGEYVAIIGATNFGIVLSQLAMYYQAIPILIDTDGIRLRTAEKYGIYYTVNATLADAEKSILEITSGRLSDHTVYDMKATLPPYLALDFTKKSGCVALANVGLFSDKEFKIQTIVKKQLSLIGVENGAGYIETAINMLATKVIDTEGLIDKIVPFAEVPEVAKNLKQFPGRYSKAVVDCNE